MIRQNRQERRISEADRAVELVPCDQSEKRGAVASAKHLVFGLVALVITAGYFSFLAYYFSRESHPQPFSPDLPDTFQIPTPPDDSVPDALGALEAFFEAPDLISKAALVRDSERVTPMILDYHGDRGHPFPTLGRINKTRISSFNSNPMVLFEVEPFSGLRYPVAVVWDIDRFAVDWESLTAYGTIDWLDFTENKPSATHTLRVFLLEARSHDIPVGLPEGYTCFRIEHRDTPESLLAIASPEVSPKLLPMVEAKRVPMVLEIAWRPLGVGSAEFPEILRFVSPGWSQ